MVMVMVVEQNIDKSQNVTLETEGSRALGISKMWINRSREHPVSLQGRPQQNACVDVFLKRSVWSLGICFSLLWTLF